MIRNSSFFGVGKHYTKYATLRAKKEGLGGEANIWLLDDYSFMFHAQYNYYNDNMGYVYQLFLILNKIHTYAGRPRYCLYL